MELKNLSMEDRLSRMDTFVPAILGLGMSEGIFLKIEYVYGFEKFNTRPYHNYETWAGGWRLTDTKNDISFEEEYLSKAIDMWIRKVEAKQKLKDKKNVTPDD